MPVNPVGNHKNEMNRLTLIIAANQGKPHCIGRYPAAKGRYLLVG